MIEPIVSDIIKDPSKVNTINETDEISNVSIESNLENEDFVNGNNSNIEGNSNNKMNKNSESNLESDHILKSLKDEDNKYHQKYQSKEEYDLNYSLKSDTKHHSSPYSYDGSVPPGIPDKYNSEERHEYSRHPYYYDGYNEPGAGYYPHSSYSNSRASYGSYYGSNSDYYYPPRSHVGYHPYPSHNAPPNSSRKYTSPSNASSSRSSAKSTSPIDGNKEPYGQSRRFRYHNDYSSNNVNSNSIPIDHPPYPDAYTQPKHSFILDSKGKPIINTTTTGLESGSSTNSKTHQGSWPLDNTRLDSPGNYDRSSSSSHNHHYPYTYHPFSHYPVDKRDYYTDDWKNAPRYPTDYPSYGRGYDDHYNRPYEGPPGQPFHPGYDHYNEPPYPINHDYPPYRPYGGPYNPQTLSGDDRYVGKSEDECNDNRGPKYNDLGSRSNSINPLPLTDGNNARLSTASSSTSTTTATNSTTLNTGKTAKKQIKNHVCQSCGKAFTTSNRLTRHFQIHTGAKPYECVIDGCNKYFARKDNMIQHCRTHLFRAGNLNPSSVISAIENTKKILESSRKLGKDGRRKTEITKISVKDIENSVMVNNSLGNIIKSDDQNNEPINVKEDDKKDNSNNKNKNINNSSNTTNKDQITETNGDIKEEIPDKEIEMNDSAIDSDIKAE